MKYFESPTYGKITTKLYGNDLKQLGMATMNQLQILCDTLLQNDCKRFLDLGCSCGQITKWLSEQLSSEAIGVDIDTDALSYANKTNDKASIQYKHINFNELNFPPRSFDAIISIDTLYFCNSIIDIENILTNCLQLLSKNGILAVYWENCPLQLFQNQTNHPFDTPIGQWALKHNIDFTPIDFSKNVLPFWDTWELFEKNKEKLIEEIGVEFYDEMKHEWTLVNKFHKENPNAIGKWLYIIKAN
ncbi:class I SAM-dependent methyltransferase [Paludicola sp. MB14-C6]|uniref:class I SAM-dependent methyltransferase n=1 Tax=Paludihabitans sp. MB14-C6 TaxID=3070656 RepID=UPI0027DB9455|nr:class I SAM-dependent methyltransferase [Paludicola sp. MB14-C6]WMJ23573.1 class I SAM-dependent methyltransferase [Paludicola sp. MB14-C6]